MKLEYISYSGFTTYLECPQKYYRQYITKEQKVPEDVRNTLCGKVVHLLLETYLEGDQDKEPEWISENVEWAWNTEVNKALESPKEEIIWRDDTDEEVLKAKCEKWAKKMPALLVKAGLTEGEIYSELKVDRVVNIKDKSLKLGGRVDVTKRTEAGNLIFYDLKGSENKSIMNFDQIIWYSLLLGLKEKDHSQPVLGGYILPGFDAIKLYQISTLAKSELLGKIYDVIEKIEAEIWTPSESWKCRFCRVNHVCPIYGKELPKQAGIVSLDDMV